VELDRGGVAWVEYGNRYEFERLRSMGIECNAELTLKVSILPMRGPWCVRMGCSEYGEGVSLVTRSF
jgi:hypothetical protein